MSRAVLCPTLVLARSEFHSSLEGKSHVEFEMRAAPLADMLIERPYLDAFQSN